jgi:hypothetical protein
MQAKYPEIRVQLVGQDGATSDEGKARVATRPLRRQPPGRANGRHGLHRSPHRALGL